MVFAILPKDDDDRITIMFVSLHNHGVNFAMLFRMESIHIQKIIVVFCFIRWNQKLLKIIFNFTGRYKHLEYIEVGSAVLCLCDSRGFREFLH